MQQQLLISVIRLLAAVEAQLHALEQACGCSIATEHVQGPRPERRGAGAFAIDLLGKALPVGGCLLHLPFAQLDLDRAPGRATGAHADGIEASLPHPADLDLPHLLAIIPGGTACGGSGGSDAGNTGHVMWVLRERWLLTGLPSGPATAPAPSVRGSAGPHQGRSSFALRFDRAQPGAPQCVAS